MRLDFDLVRDILIFFESTADGTQCFVVETLPDAFPGAKPDAVLYHLKYMRSAGLIEGDGLGIIDLTPKGHETLANIRHKSVYDKVKSIAQSLKVESLPAFQQIAANVASDIIKAHLNI